jgi:hypothetical protein
MHPQVFNHILGIQDTPNMKVNVDAANRFVQHALNETQTNEEQKYSRKSVDSKKTPPTKKRKQD